MYSSKEKKAAYDKAYRAANPEKARAYDSARKEKRAEKYIENREARLAQMAGYREANRELLRKKALIHYHKNKERISVGNTERRRQKLTNFTPELFALALDIQKGACAICGAPLIKSRHADHDHSTGAPRGLLCAPCNMGLGSFKDDEARLLAAIKYLANPPLALA